MIEGRLGTALVVLLGWKDELGIGVATCVEG